MTAQYIKTKNSETPTKLVHPIELSTHANDILQATHEQSDEISTSQWLVCACIKAEGSQNFYDCQAYQDQKLRAHDKR